MQVRTVLQERDSSLQNLQKEMAEVKTESHNLLQQKEQHLNDTKLELGKVRFYLHTTAYKGHILNFEILADFLYVCHSVFDSKYHTVVNLNSLFLTHLCRRQPLKLFSSPTIVGDHFLRLLIGYSFVMTRVTYAT